MKLFFCRFGTALCFTVVYAALLTKTNRISRIFNASKQSAKRPSLISPKSQLLICSVLVSIQVSVIGTYVCILNTCEILDQIVESNVLLVSGGRGGGVVGGVTGACDVSLSDARGQHARVRLVRGRLLHDRLLLSDPAHPRVHSICCPYQENS